MSSKEQEWVGGKQVYPNKPAKPKDDDWLSEFSDDDFGFNHSVKSKPSSRTIETAQEQK